MHKPHSSAKAVCFPLKRQTFWQLVRWLATVFHQSRGITSGVWRRYRYGRYKFRSSCSFLGLWHWKRWKWGGYSRRNVSLAAPHGNLAQLHETLWTELSGWDARETCQDVSDFQACIMLLLDTMTEAQPMERGTKIESFQRLGESPWKIGRSPARWRWDDDCTKIS